MGAAPYKSLEQAFDSLAAPNTLYKPLPFDLAFIPHSTIFANLFSRRSVCAKSR